MNDFNLLTCRLLFGLENVGFEGLNVVKAIRPCEPSNVGVIPSKAWLDEDSRKCWGFIGVG